MFATFTRGWTNLIIKLLGLIIFLLVAHKKHLLATFQEGGVSRELPPSKLLSRPIFKSDPVCEFFQSGRQTPLSSSKWGRYNLCDMTEADRWIRQAASRCQDCISRDNICLRTPQLKLHMYLAHLDRSNWQANLLSIKAFLLTQDLSRSKLWIWTDEVNQIVTSDTLEFFTMFADVVSVKQLVWNDQIEATPLSSHPYFSNVTRLQLDFKDYIAGYADLVRHVLLYKHGGLWIDTDVLLLRDVYPVTVQVGYQFVMRWVNNHIYFLKARSALGLRILKTVAALQYEDSRAWRRQIMHKTCGPLGYSPVTDSKKLRDIYNICVLKLVMASEENFGQDGDNVLFDHPLGWWDQHWLHKHTKAMNWRRLNFFAALDPSCPSLDAVQDPQSFQNSIQAAMSLHTRYPGHKGHVPKQGSQLARTIQIIDSVFDKCQDRNCIGQRGSFLVDFLQSTDQ